MSPEHDENPDFTEGTADEPDYNPDDPGLTGIKGG